MEPSVPSKDHYIIGWIAALAKELTAAIRMLDSQYPCPTDFVKSSNDPNVYVWGKIGDHNIVIAFLEAGAYGTTLAATTASYLLSAFPNIKIGLLPDGKSGGVYQYDLQKARAGRNSETIGTLNRPSTFLLKVLELVKAQHLAEPSKVPDYLRLITPEMADPPHGTPGYVYQGAENARLFKSTFSHVSVSPAPKPSKRAKCFDLNADDSDSEGLSLACPYCPPEQEVKRKPRRSESILQFHYGTIASGNTVVKDAE